MGCMSAIVFTCFGAAYGTAKSGVGISAMGVLRPDLIVKSKSSHLGRIAYFQLDNCTPPTPFTSTR